MSARSLHRKHADFQGAERPPCVAVANLGEKVERVLYCMDRPGAEAAFLVGQSALEHRLDLLARQRLKRENLAAAQERRIDGEKRVLRRRPNKNDAAFLDIGQKHILLGAVETVQLIDEEDGTSASVGQLGACFFEQLAHFLDADRDRIDLTEDALRLVGDDMSERGLAAPGRAVEEDGAEPIGLQQASQQFAFAEEVLLAGEFIQRTRPHAGGQRLRLLQVRFMRLAEEIDGMLLMGYSPPPGRGEDSPAARRIALHTRAIV